MNYSFFLSGVVSGALTSTAALVGTASSGLSMLSGDDSFNRQRAVKAQQSSRGGFVKGIMGGGESVVTGIASGVTGLFTKPIEEAQKDGAFGFIRGVGMGVLGAAVKPVLGVTDGLASVAHGISNELSDQDTRERIRPPRAFSRSEADPTELILTPFNLTAAQSQAYILKMAKKGEFSDSYVESVVLDSSTSSRVILTEKLFYWIISKERVLSKRWSGISHCTFIAPQSVGIVMYENSGGNDMLTIPCRGRVIAMQLYEVLAANAFRMGNPGSVASVASVISGQLTIRGSLSKQGSLKVVSDIDGYRFGSANTSPSIPLPSGASTSDRHIIRRAESRFKEMDGEWGTIDLICWSLVKEWDGAHTGLTASRCCLLLIINRSSHPVQVNKLQVIHGKAVYFLPVFGYSSESKQVAVNGSVVVFSIANSNHASFSATTSAGVFIASTKAGETQCDCSSGVNAGFVEKSVSEWWAKYVLIIAE